MGWTYLFWAVGAATMILVAVKVGTGAHRPEKLRLWYGIVIDNRGRVSLSRSQLVVWTVLVFSLVTAVIIGRWIDGADAVLSFDIPDELLAVLGISLGSGLLAEVVKTNKDNDPTVTVLDAGEEAYPRAAQLFLEEDRQRTERDKKEQERRANAKLLASLDEPGNEQPASEEEEPRPAPDRDVISIPKFQNFFISLILVFGYLVAAIAAFDALEGPSDIDALPAFEGSLALLLGISHAAYVGGKIPTRRVAD